MQRPCCLRHSIQFNSHILIFFSDCNCKRTSYRICRNYPIPVEITDNIPSFDITMASAISSLQKQLQKTMLMQKCAEIERHCQKADNSLILVSGS